jgi:cardiolipin synthase (CMP-forming)
LNILTSEQPAVRSPLHPPAGHRQILNVPNALSLLRVLLLPLVLIAMRNGQDAWLLALMLAGASTDWLDGHLARKLNQVSDSGKIADPLADKICADVLAVALWLWRGFPWWAMAALVGRDLLILAGALLVMRTRRTVPVSNRAGKMAMASLAAAIICYAMRWQPGGYFILLAGMALAVVSGAQYLRTHFSKTT